MRGWSVFIAGLTTAYSLAWPALSQTLPTGQVSPQIHKEWVLDKQTAQDLDSRDGLIDDAAILQYLQRVENRVAVAAGHKPLEMHLTGSRKFYGVVLENRAGYLSAGLVIRLENEMELAGLLAHQLAHLPIAGAACVLSPFAIPERNAPSRNQEQRANAHALDYLKAAGYDPTGLPDLFSKLAYEHPVFAQAMVSEDLLSLRSAIESEEPPAGGYRVDTDEFSEQHDNLLAIFDWRARQRASRVSSRPILARCSP